jgi:hypothetical protein
MITCNCHIATSRRNQLSLPDVFLNSEMVLHALLIDGGSVFASKDFNMALKYLDSITSVGTLAIARKSYVDSSCFYFLQAIERLELVHIVAGSPSLVFLFLIVESISTPRVPPGFELSWLLTLDMSVYTTHYSFVASSNVFTTKIATSKQLVS